MTLENPLPVGDELAMNFETESFELGSTTMATADVDDLIVKIESGNDNESRRIDIQDLHPQSDRMVSSVDRTIVFTVSE